MSNWLQWAIIIFIVLAIAYLSFRRGTANPETTGALSRAFAAQSAEMGKLSSRLGRVEIDMEEVKRDGATTKDIDRIEMLLDERTAAMRAEIAGHKELAERTYRSVERIERFLIERGIGGGR